MTADLVCFGYLAHATVLVVEHYPERNNGAAVHQILPSLAGDAPIAALTARQLGTPHVQVVSNRVGVDPPGISVLETLQAAGVTTTHQTINDDTEHRTPQVTIVSDSADNRTWFAWLGTAANQLVTAATAAMAPVAVAADMNPLSTARLVYIDCYRIIDTAAATAIRASRAPLLLNLGGDPLSPAVVAAARQRHVAIVQTSLYESAPRSDADRIATDVRRRLDPEMVVITLGRNGAIGYTATGSLHVPALTVSVQHSHGAGAAFSGGLAHSYLAGADASQAIRTACRVASMHCHRNGRIPHQVKETQ